MQNFKEGQLISKYMMFFFKKKSEKVTWCFVTTESNKGTMNGKIASKECINNENFF